MTHVRRIIDVPCNFSPLSPQEQPEEPLFLFVQDLQIVDDVFEIKSFWAKDLKGLERLSQADILSLGLREPYLSKICIRGHPETLHASQLSKDVERQGNNWHPKWVEMEELRDFHEALGFASGSLDTSIACFLDLPIACVKWDGMSHV